MLCVLCAAWFVYTTTSPLIPSVAFAQHMYTLTLWLPFLIVPFPSLELVGDVLQQPGEFDGVLLEHISTETSQPWLGENQTLV